MKSPPKCMFRHLFRRWPSISVDFFFETLIALRFVSLGQENQEATSFTDLWNCDKLKAFMKRIEVC